MFNYLFNTTVLLAMFLNFLICVFLSHHHYLSLYVSLFIFDLIMFDSLFNTKLFLCFLFSFSLFLSLTLTRVSRFNYEAVKK